MEETGLTFSRLAYDDSAWRIFLRASNSAFTGILEFYTDAATLIEFGQRLVQFPRMSSEEVRFELGTRDGNSAFYLLFRAYILDRSGHTALEISLDNHGKCYHHAEANFTIACDPSSLNQLGRRICAWVENSDEPLVWMACNS